MKSDGILHDSHECESQWKMTPAVQIPQQIYIYAYVSFNMISIVYVIEVEQMQAMDAR